MENHGNTQDAAISSLSENTRTAIDRLFGKGAADRRVHEARGIVRSIVDRLGPTDHRLARKVAIDQIWSAFNRDPFWLLAQIKDCWSRSKSKENRDRWFLAVMTREIRHRWPEAS